jgi:hypothetical protein
MKQPGVRMLSRRSFALACALLSALCLAGGLAFVSLWVGIAAAVVGATAWLLATRRPAGGLPLVCLAGSVCLAAVGTLLGGPAPLMIAAPALALPAWDLLLLEARIGKTSITAQVRRYEDAHLRSLALALVPALVVALLGHALRLQMPFFVLALLVALAVFGLTRVWRTINKAGSK